MDNSVNLKLHEYARLLGAANSRARLTGPSAPDVLFEEHIMDAASALSYLPERCSFVDVGTGGGIPGMVWGICRPDTRGVLLESVGKKAALVSEMAEALGVRNISVVNARSEDFAAEHGGHRELFDVAAARAVARAPLLAELLSPLARVGGRIIAFKGPRVYDELNIPPDKWSLLGLSPPALHSYSASESKELYLVIWEKTSPCARSFPRRPGAVKKLRKR
jgi:16S rRNA (guanine527-N7)-methyltransferase